jgi:hypothetical protein
MWTILQNAGTRGITSLLEYCAPGCLLLEAGEEKTDGKITM